MTIEPTEPTPEEVETYPEEPVEEVVPEPEPEPVPLDPDPAPPMVNVDPEITSVFMKVSRAVDGDDHFKQRAEMALEIMGKPITRQNLIHIARSVADSIICTVSGRVDTSKVTDDEIMNAMEDLPESF